MLFAPSQGAQQGEKLVGNDFPARAKFIDGAVQEVSMLSVRNSLKWVCAHLPSPSKIGRSAAPLSVRRKALFRAVASG